MKILLWWLLKRWAARQPQARYVFERGEDGISCEVTCSVCSNCKNYSFVNRFEIEPTSFCPYCGIKFKGTVPITREEMEKKVGTLL